MSDVEIMKWCQAHWTELRESIYAHGLGHLVSKDGAAAAAHMADELNVGNARDVEGFDPLLRTWSMINMRALEMGASLAGCPLCYVQTHHDTCQNPECRRLTPTEWITGCVQAGREYVRSLGLLRDT